MNPMLIDAQTEDALEKARSSRIRFKQQLFLGMGGAIIFALVGSIGANLLHSVVTSMGTALAAHTTVAGALMSSAVLAPLLGLVGIAALGLGCIYLGSKFLSEGISRDQDAQARKISLAAQGVAPEIVQHLAPTFTQPTLGAEDAKTAAPAMDSAEMPEADTRIAANSNILQTRIAANTVERSMAMPEQMAMHRSGSLA